MSSIPVKGVKSESNTTQALLREATKKRIAYLLSKRVIRDIDVYKLVKDFFKEYLHEHYEFTFDELAEELKKTYIEKHIKESLYRLLEDFSTIEYKDEEIPEEVLRNTLTVFTKLVDELLGKSSNKKNFFSKLFNKQEETSLPKKEIIAEPKEQIEKQKTNFTEEVSRNQTENMQSPPTDFGDISPTNDKDKEQNPDKEKDKEQNPFPEESSTNVFPEELIPKEQLEEEKNSLVQVKEQTNISQTESSETSLIKENEPVNNIPDEEKTVEAKTITEEKASLEQIEIPQENPQVESTPLEEEGPPIPPPQEIDIDSIDVPEPHKTQESSQSTEFQVPALEDKSEFAKDESQKPIVEEPIVKEISIPENAQVEKSMIGKRSNWSKEAIHEKQQEKTEEEFPFNQETPTKQQPKEDIILQPLPTENKESSEKLAEEPILSQEILLTQEKPKEEPNLENTQKENLLSAEEIPIEAQILKQTEDTSEEIFSKTEDQEDVFITTEQPTQTNSKEEQTKESFSSEEIPVAPIEIPTQKPEKKDKVYFGSEEQELSADLNKLAEQLDAVIKDDDFRTQSEALIIADDIPTLVMETERLIVEKNHEEAQTVYKELVGRYHELPEEKKHVYYDKIQHLYDLLQRNA